MSDRVEPRFKGSIRIHIRDNVFGNAMVINTSYAGKKRDDFVSKAKKKLDEYTKMMDSGINEKTLHSHAKYLMETEKWSVKRVKNHFARFGIDIEPFINPQKKLSVDGK